jgi:hypothetical protein
MSIAQSIQWGVNQQDKKSRYTIHPSGSQSHAAIIGDL